ncbi:MAG: redoxin family protein [Planctomycetales bacterium]|nr:redoxin family protein [Planctomycetales bacterium]
MRCLCFPPLSYRQATGWIVVFAMAALACPSAFAAEPVDRSVPLSEAVNLEALSLVDLYGNSVMLGEHFGPRATVFAFLGVECPLAKLYGPRLSEMAAEFEDRGVRFVGINSNSQDSLVEITAFRRRQNVAIPMLKDNSGACADALGATRTPEVILVDATGQIRYRGRVDDQYGVGYVREKPTQRDLHEAIEAILSGREITQSETRAVGCLIGRPPAASGDDSITYTRDIAPLLQKHCVECHREGEIGPFSLTDYDEVAGWAETLVEVMKAERMPPWHANPEYGHFRNQRQMTPEEKETIYQWVSHGVPQGDPADLPPAQEYVTGWRLPRDPDVVVQMRDRPFPVADQGVIEYQYFVVDPGFDEDKWIAAAEVIPGNRAVVHHCIVFVRPPDEVGLRGFGWLSAYVPGQVPLVLPPGCGRRIPAGSKLVFQMHYTPIGSPQEDLTKVGIVFAEPEEITEETLTLVAINRNFQIPPGDGNYEVQATVNWMPPSGRLLALAPHMHLRGKSFRFTAHRPAEDGGMTTEVLLDVPHYDFNWQHVYELADPLPIDKGLKIEASAHFDNSVKNLVNPDPDSIVRWGDQTWQEMMVGFLDVAVPRDQKLDLPWGSRFERKARTAAERRAAGEALIDRFDKNGDDQIQRNEVPTEFAIFGFSRFDADKDGVITYDEACGTPK